MAFHLWYNTQNAKILFKEYGRNIQAMVAYILSIDDRQKRSRAAQGIVQTMGELLPAQNKKSQEFQHKLWDHLHIMANFELDIDSPFPKPTIEEQQKPKSNLGYPVLHYKNRHYGNHVQQLIQLANQLNDGEQKNTVIEVIAHYMKMVHKNLNNEIASEETIRNDLKNLSKGTLDIIFTEQNTLVLEPDPPKKKRKRKRSHNKLTQQQVHTSNYSNSNQNNANNSDNSQQTNAQSNKQNIQTIITPPDDPNGQANQLKQRKRKRNRKKK